MPGIEEIDPMDEYPNKMRFQDFRFMNAFCDAYPQFESARPAKPRCIGVSTLAELLEIEMPCNPSLMDIAITIEKYLKLPVGSHLTKKTSPSYNKLRRAVIFHAIRRGFQKNHIAKYLNLDPSTVTRICPAG